MIIVLGRFFSGFFISPATAAIFVTPAYEMYRKATPAIKPDPPSENTGSISLESNELNPKKTIVIKDNTLIVTMTSCVFSTFLTPNTFKRSIKSKANSAMYLVYDSSTSIKTYR